MTRPVIHATCIALMLKRLSDQDPASYAMLADVTGLHVTCVRAYVKAMRKHKLVRVAAWLPGGRWGAPTTEGWALGPGEDVPRPAKWTRGEIGRRYRDRRAGRPVLAARPADVLPAEVVHSVDGDDDLVVEPTRQAARFTSVASCKECSAPMRVLETRGERRRLECRGCGRRVTARGDLPAIA